MVTRLSGWIKAVCLCFDIRVTVSATKLNSESVAGFGRVFLIIELVGSGST